MVLEGAAAAVDSELTSAPEEKHLSRNCPYSGSTQCDQVTDLHTQRGVQVREHTGWHEKLGTLQMHLLTHNSEVLVEQSHVDRQQIRQSDGQTAAQTDVCVSRVHQVQH